MKEYGLDNVHLEPWTIPIGWERGTANLRIIEPDNGKSLIVASWAWTPGTKGPIEGDVVIFQPRSKEDLAKYKGKLKNAIVLRSPPDDLPPSVTAFLTPQGGGRRGQFGRGGDKAGEKGGEKGGDKAADKGGDKAGDNAGGRRGFGRGNFGGGGGFMEEVAEFLRVEGAVCTLRDSGKPHGLLTMSGSWQTGRGGTDRGNAGDRLPSLVIAHDHYALLWRLAKRPEPAKTRV